MKFSARPPEGHGQQKHQLLHQSGISWCLWWLKLLVGSLSNSVSVGFTSVQTKKPGINEGIKYQKDKRTMKPA